MEQAPQASVVTLYIGEIKAAWNSFDFEAWAESIGGSSSSAVQAALCFCSGFIIGFLFKKYFRFFFFCLIITLFLVKLLEYNVIITIDWDKFCNICGVESGAGVNSLITHCFDWLKGHIVIAVSSLVGFLFGYRFG